jgi:hypothetical protein
MSASTIVNTSSTSQTKTGFFWAQGIGSNAGGYFADSVGISTTSMSAKLNVMKVVESGPSSLGYGIESYIRPTGLSNWYSNSTVEETAAIKGTFDSTTRTNYEGSGVMGVSHGSNLGYGVLGITYSDFQGRVAVMGDATKSVYSGGIGVKGTGSPGGQGVMGVADYGGEGVAGYAVAPGGGVHGWGVYGEVTSGNGWGVVGKGRGSGGDFYASGGGGTRYGSASSIRWKHDVKTMENILDKISQIRGVTFIWNEDHGGERDIGFIAEEIGKVFPEAVSYEANGIDVDAVDYTKFSAVAIQGINELNQKNKVLETEIELLRTKNKALEERITRLEALIK